MIGRRKTDWPSPFFVAFVLVASLGVAMAIHTAYPPRDVVQVKPVDGCVGGKLHSWDGKKWRHVELKGKKRPVPCGDEK